MRKLFLAIFLLTLTAQAEQRVFQLKITNTKTKKSWQILSTMDPQQYIGYHGLGWYETVEILDHWMCWERHQRFASLCTRPTAKKQQGLKPGLQRLPASETSDTSL